MAVKSQHEPHQADGDPLIAEIREKQVQRQAQPLVMIRCIGAEFWLMEINH